MRVKFFVGVFLFGFSVISSAEKVPESLVELDIKEDLPVCHHMADLINKDMNIAKNSRVGFKYRDIYYESHNEFTDINWQLREMVLYDSRTGEDIDGILRKPWQISYIDLNNDGKKEWVSIVHYYMYGESFYRLAVHDQSFGNQHRIAYLYYKNDWTLGRSGSYHRVRWGNDRRRVELRKITVFYFEGRNYLLFSDTSIGNMFFVGELKADFSKIIEFEKRNFDNVNYLCLIKTKD